MNVNNANPFVSYIPFSLFQEFVFLMVIQESVVAPLTQSFAPVPTSTDQFTFDVGQEV
jgi:hypothetical protein